MPEEEKGFGKRHFLIKYDPEQKKYFLKDLEEGTGTFIKIAPKWELRNNSVISFGETHFATIFPPNNMLSGTISQDPKQIGSPANIKS